MALDHLTSTEQPIHQDHFQLDLPNQKPNPNPNQKPNPNQPATIIPSNQLPIQNHFLVPVPDPISALSKLVTSNRLSSQHPSKEKSEDHSKDHLTNHPEPFIHHPQPTVPINSKSPIPTFYEHVNGIWVLSDNWNLYGLSGPSQRHRPRSLDEPQNPSESSPSASPLVHHTSLPLAQFDYSNSNSTSSSPSNSSQKLYLPAGWNHTSRRGPLYVVPAIVVTSLFIALTVVGTVVFLVARRRAARSDLRSLQAAVLAKSSRSSTSPVSLEIASAKDDEERVAMATHTPLRHRLRHLTIVRIRRLTRGRQEARISRIAMVPSPGTRKPPSLVVIDDSNTHSSSAPSQASRSSAWPRPRHIQRRSRPAGLSQQDFSHDSHHDHPDPNSLPDSSPSSVTCSAPLPPHGNNGVAFPVLPSVSMASDSTFASGWPVPGPSSSSELSQGAGPTRGLVSSVASSSPGPRTTSGLQLGAPLVIQAPAAGSPVASTSTAPPNTHASTDRRTSRATLEPNYQTCLELVRARSLRASRGPWRPEHAPPPLPVGPRTSGLRSSSSHDELVGHGHGTEGAAQEVRAARRRSRSYGAPASGQFAIGNVMLAGQDERLRSEHVGAAGLPPAYSSWSNAHAQGSRALEKQRADEDVVEESAQEEEEEDARFVGHVATDDKDVLGRLMGMGSVPEPAMADGQGASAPPLVWDQDGFEVEGLGMGDERDRRRAPSAPGVDDGWPRGVERPSAPPMVWHDHEGLDRPGVSSEKRSSGGSLPREGAVGDGGAGQWPGPPEQFVIRFDPDLEAGMVLGGGTREAEGELELGGEAEMVVPSAPLAEDVCNGERQRHEQGSGPGPSAPPYGQ